MDKNINHIPVMLKEVLRWLDLKPHLTVVDATFGLGGHGFEVAKRIEPGLLIGLEKDPYTYSIIIRKISPLSNIKIFNTGYEDLDEVMLKIGLNRVDRVFFDLGISSVSLHNGRGFSYKSDEVLDLRFNPNHGKPAYEFLKEADEGDIERVLRTYGEEKKSKIIARKIVGMRKKVDVITTRDISRIIDEVYPTNRRNKVKSRVWQALRIHINNELENLRKGLALALKYLVVGGRLVIISFHSLEDRAVKSLRNYRFVEPLTKKPLTPSNEEIKSNPRSRSAKMRVYLKVAEVDYHGLLRDKRFAYPFMEGVRRRRRWG